MKTYAPRPRDIERRWYVIDASGAVLGRLASEVAAVLRGKHKPMFAPHMDTGDHVIVVNAAEVRLTGAKEEKKFAYHHSGYPGGLTETNYATLLAKKPAFVVEKAIRGMLPKNRLGRAMVKKLQVYAGPEHPHEAQQPQPLSLGQIPKWDGLPKPEAKPVKEVEPEPKARRRRVAARPVAKPAAKRTTAKRTSASKPSAAKTTAKAATAKRTTAKRASAAKPAAKVAKTAPARRAKKEE